MIRRKCNELSLCPFRGGKLGPQGKRRLEEGVIGVLKKENSTLKGFSTRESRPRERRGLRGGIKSSGTKGILEERSGPQDASRGGSQELETEDASKEGEGISKIKETSKLYTP